MQPIRLPSTLEPASLVGSALGALLVAAALPGTPASAQDVELLGRQYGTRPPPAYYQELAEDPDAFQFSRGWGRRTGLPMPASASGQASISSSLEGMAAQRAAAVAGAFRIPMILGLFSDSPGPPFSVETIQREFFDGPNSRFQTITEYYREISGGRLELGGNTFDWRRTQLTRAQTAGGVSGLNRNGARTGEFIVDILAQVDDGSVDWGRFDNDGPDGVPNSGDDDGFVDVLAVVHPTFGAECNQSPDHIWSHRFRISAWIGTWYVTRSPSASGGPIRINDYTIQPVQSCAAVGGAPDINQIGVFAHELGHGFGLPDLYDTEDSDGRHGAAGDWSLMATGSWGCSNSDASRPCHMNAWSKAVLGWVDVDTLAPGLDQGTLSLEPVETGNRVLFAESGDGSGEYFLLENRQPIGFDRDLRGTGLLVWHIDPEVLASRWASNRVNVDPDRQGVWLRQADGQEDLSRVGGGRGDDGDPFPGSAGKRSFHAGSSPASISHRGRSTGFTILDVTEVDERIEARVLTRYQNVALGVLGAPPEEGLFTVDGAAPGESFAFRSAPFEHHTLRAASGVEIEEGLRAGFEEWTDGTSEPERDFVTGLADTTMVARYGDREVRFSAELSSAAEGISPGELQFSQPAEDGWFPEGIELTVLAAPRTGFAFREWTGALAGGPNPATLTLDAPVTVGAHFDVTFGIGGLATVRAPFEAATRIELVLAAENANLPVTWSLEEGALPSGLGFFSDGLIRGAALETGAFPALVRVTDAIGLEASADLVLEVTEPILGLDELTAPFLLTGGDLTFHQRQFLDRGGNGNGGYDLGDLRAYIIRNPELPLSGEVGVTPVRIVVPVVDLGSAHRAGVPARRQP